MKYSTFLIPIVGASLLSFSVASSQNATTQGVGQAKEKPKSASVQPKPATTQAKMKSESRLSARKAKSTSRKTTATAVTTKKKPAGKRVFTQGKSAKQTGSKTTAHRTHSKRGKRLSGTAQHAKQSLKAKQSPTQKKSSS